ncbi:unnamed protein product [Schistosoma guineensis]|nr:unnamed protein product [Schistosoma guineensis]
MKTIVFLLILLVISSEITFDVEGGPDEGGPHADSSHSHGLSEALRNKAGKDYLKKHGIIKR